MKNVLIICHAGKGVGLGHLTRSLVIARSMQQNFDAEINFLVQGNVVNKDYLRDFEHQFLETNQDLSIKIRQLVADFDIQILVFDLYPEQVPKDFVELLTDLKLNGCKLIGIDGLIDYHKKLDLIFIPSFNFSPPPNLIIETPVFFGWDCYLLNIKKKQIEWQSGKRVLVLTGGSDTTKLGKTLPSELNDVLPDYAELNWVTGPFADEPIFPKQSKFDMQNHHAPSELDGLMINSNYAMTVFGVSFFELLYYGVPTVVFSPYGHKDDSELKMIESEGVALVAIDEVDAINKLKMLMMDDKLAASLSEKSKKLMSFPSGQRFVQAVSELEANV
jgi:spore coat polysaccharide biosynthesis predicted glycosyltransferase SpsG